MDREFILKSKELLMRNKIEIGIKAGYFYPDFWVRDALISSLGMVLSGDEELKEIARKSIDTASKHQKFIGQIPNKIIPDESKICFGEGGCVDSSLWYPIAVLNYFKKTNDFEFLKSNYEKIILSMNWALGLDQNADWLIETNEGADWMDMLLRSGRVLYDNILLYKALKDTDEILRTLNLEQKFNSISENIKEAINLFFWPTKENLETIKLRYGHTGLEKDVETLGKFIEQERNFYLADMGFREFDPRFDTFSNLLAIIFDVADEDKKKKIFDYIKKEKIDEPYPLKVLHPPILKSDPFWNNYFRWTDLPYLQEPGNFHNGGIWPFVGGFYIAALKKEKRDFENGLSKLVESCKLCNWGFYEWISAQGMPGGSKDQTWSAAMLLYAYYY